MSKLRYALFSMLICLHTTMVSAGALFPSLTPSPPKLTARNYLLLDYDSQQLLVEHNIDQRIEPASLTKMMTVYIVDKALAGGKIKLEDKVRISKKAWHTPGSRMFAEVNTKITVNDLLKGIIIQSGNDASTAIAEYVAGSENAFVDLMNQEAKHLKMTGSHFANATGLPAENHYTTARDMATLSRAIIHDFPQSYTLYAKKWFTYNNIKQPNRNRLLWRDNSVDGLKTGHTKDAGFCLVASAKRDNMRLISVVMGAKSDEERSNESEQLLNFGFRFYETHLIYKPNTPVTSAQVWMGNKHDLPLGIDKPLYITIPQGQYQNLNATATFENAIQAPVHARMPYGLLTISLNKQILSKVPLLALTDIEEGSLWSQSKDRVKRLWNDLFSDDDSQLTQTL